MMISDCDNDKDRPADNETIADCSLLSESDNGERQQINLISIICTGN